MPLLQKDSVQLPFDLEREILELTALAIPGQAFKLCTLSRNVQEWMEAIIYGTVLLEWPGVKPGLFMRTFYARSPSFFAQNVKRLFLIGQNPSDDACKLIAACSGATNVTCWLLPNTLDGFNFLHLLHTQNLRRLSVTFDALSDVDGLEKPMKFTPDLFPNLTHLEIAYPTDDILDAHPNLDVDWASLATLPSLKYLAVGDIFGRDDANFAVSIRYLLDECPNLRGLMLVTDGLHLREALVARQVHESDKVLLIDLAQSVLPGYWEGIMRGEPGHWDMAECYTNPGLSRRYVSFSRTG